MHPPSRLVIIAALAAVSASLLAQDAGEDPAAVPASTPEVVVPPGGIVTQPVTPTGIVPAPKYPSQFGGQPTTLVPTDRGNNGGSGGPEEMVPNMQFPNADIKAILDFYEKLTGKHPIYDNTVQGQMPIVVTKPITKSEAVRIIETTFLMNGFTMVPGADNTVKILGQGKNPRQFGVPLFSELSRLPEGDGVVSFLFKLQYADPVEVTAQLSQYVPPSPYSLYMALPKSQAILVSENVAVIRSLARIIAEVDHPPADVVEQYITLERADAKDVVDKLNSLFEKQANGSGATPGSPAAPRQPVPIAVDGQPPSPDGSAPTEPGAGVESTLSEDSLIVGKIKMTADVRTNRIYVVTRPINMPFIRRLIAELDSDTPFGEPTKFPLRFVSAGDVLDVIVKAITDPGVKSEDSAGGGAKAATPVSNPSNFGGSSGSSSNGSSGSSSLGTEELTTTPVETVPQAVTVGNTKIIADKRDNAIIVLGNEEVKGKIRKILEQVDVRAPQVMINVVIGELTLNKNQQFGVDYLAHSGKFSTSGSNAVVIPGGFNTVSGNTGLDLSSLITAAGIPAAGAGGLTAFYGGIDSLDVIVRALNSTGNFKVISRPMVFTSNNKKAVIASGQKIPVPGNIQSGVGVNSGIGGITNNNSLVSTTNVDYQDVDLKLEVQPLINSDNEVTLDIVQEVNSVDNSSAALPTGSGISAPTINSRRLKTSVSVKNKATIVLGGLVQETKNDSVTGIPLLMDIPLVGRLFSNRTKGVTRSELIVLIRPTVTNNPTEDVRAGEKEQEGMNFQPDLEATLDPPGKRVKADTQQKRLLLPPKPTTVQ